MEPAAKLPRAWVRPVNPQEYPGFAERPVKPVTRADLDHQFHTVALRGFGYDRAPVAPPAAYRLTDVEETLDLWTRIYD